MDWESVIGLEVHVQLRTRTKMFCGCSTSFGDPPNTHVCPVCLGLPGALPVPNGAAVRSGVRMGLALDCTIQNVSIFERKSYFYPDLPKGYQISQFQRPLATSGSLAIASEAGPRRIGVRRLHLEEDSGRSLHDRFPADTAVDFNRSGVPLAEIVSDPELRTPEEARGYLVSLKQLLQYLDVSDCNMEEGSLRVDANLSVRRSGQPLGTKQELKNLNSFAAVVRGLTLMCDQQVEWLKSGRTVERQTFRLANNELRVMRAKEESHDYRYFPDPDLPPLILDANGIDIEAERASLPELPWDRCTRFKEALGLASNAAEVLSSARELADYFETVVDREADAVDASHWVMDVVMADAKGHGGEYRVSPERLTALMDLVSDDTLSKRAAKVVFATMADTGEDPAIVAERLGLVQVSDIAQLTAWVDGVLESYPDQVARFCAGEAKLLGFFMGRVMDVSRGQANPTRLRTLLDERLRGPHP
jgi:aspartyl-tRNA(Asn)/glutamyl-tRNA(Gln) amidotransferase subunit B